MSGFHPNSYTVLLPQEGGYYKAPEHDPELCSENTAAYNNDKVKKV